MRFKRRERKTVVAQDAAPETKDEPMPPDNARIADDVLAELSKRFELQPKKEARTCDLCGMYVYMDNGRTFTDDEGKQVWICGLKTCNYFGPGSLKEALRLGGCRILGMTPGKMGPNNLHELVTPFYRSGRTKSNHKPYGHINRYEFVAAVDRKYGRQKTGPHSGLMKVPVDTEKVRVRAHAGGPVTEKEFTVWEEQQIILEGEVATTYSAPSWRPAQPWERDDPDIESLERQLKEKMSRQQKRKEKLLRQMERTQAELEKLNA